MNDALEFYANHSKIISISGYCPPLTLPDSYPHDTFLLPRFNAWGFATWKSKFDPFRFSTTNFQEKKKDRRLVKKLTEGGADIYAMVEADCEGRINALDVRVMYHQAISDLYTVYPRQSLVQNIGHDGSGVHCGNTNKFFIKDIWQKCDNFHFASEIALDSRIVSENKKFRAVKKKNVILQHIFNLFLLKRQ